MKYKKFISIFILFNLFSVLAFQVVAMAYPMGNDHAGDVLEFSNSDFDEETEEEFEGSDFSPKTMSKLYDTLDSNKGKATTKTTESYMDFRFISYEGALIVQMSGDINRLPNDQYILLFVWTEEKGYGAIIGYYSGELTGYIARLKVFNGEGDESDLYELDIDGNEMKSGDVKEGFGEGVTVQAISISSIYDDDESVYVDLFERKSLWDFIAEYFIWFLFGAILLIGIAAALIYYYTNQRV